MSRLQRYLLPVLSVFFVIFICAGTSRAAISFSTNRAQFLKDHPRFILQTFESGNVPPVGIQDCVTPVDADSNDNCFTPGDIFPGIAFNTDPDLGIIDLIGPFLFSNLNPVNVLIPESLMQKSVITFPGNSVNAVGLDLGCLFDMSINAPCTGRSLLVQVYGAGDALLGETLLPVNSLFNSFVGISSDEQIERITFIDSDLKNEPSGFNGVARVYFPNDGLHNIPALSEYGAAALAIALGLFATYAVSRRRAVRG